MKIEIEREEDGRWIAEVPELSGVMVYGANRYDAFAKAEALALRVIADRLDPQAPFRQLPPESAVADSLILTSIFESL